MGVGIGITSIEILQKFIETLLLQRENGILLQER